MAKRKTKKNWIQKAIKKPGALRRSLKIKEDKKITSKQLDKASKSKNPTTQKRAVLAKTLRKISRNRRGKK